MFFFWFLLGAGGPAALGEAACDEKKKQKKKKKKKNFFLFSHAPTWRSTKKNKNPNEILFYFIFSSQATLPSSVGPLVPSRKTKTTENKK
jgi:hypothetical protein